MRCDCHVHIVGPHATYPQVRDRTYLAGVASVTTLKQLGGLPASAFWVETPPVQPGCAGCPMDPGPDFITIGVAVADGKTVFELTGSARMNAPASIFCDIQQTEASLSR